MAPPPLRELKLKTFLRNVHPALMRRYLASLGWRSTEKLFDLEWFSSLPDDWRERVANDLERVNHVCRKQDRDSLVEVLDARGLTICLMGDDPAERLDGIYEVALYTFVVHRDIFDRHYFNFECSRLEGRVSYRGMPGPPVETAENVADALLTLLEKHAERYPGGRCLVEQSVDGDVLRLLVSYETHLRTTETFKRGERVIEVLRYRPIGRELAIYDAATGVLSLKARPTRQTVLRESVAQCLFLEPTYFDVPVEIDPGRVLGLREQIERVADGGFKQVTGARLVAIDGTIRDAQGTSFSIRSRDVFGSLDESVCLADDRHVKEARLEFTYVDDGSSTQTKTVRIGLVAGSNKVEKPEARSWPEDEIMPLLEEWGLVRMPRSEA